MSDGWQWIIAFVSAAAVILGSFHSFVVKPMLERLDRIESRCLELERRQKSCEELHRTNG